MLSATHFPYWGKKKKRISVFVLTEKAGKKCHQLLLMIGQYVVYSRVF